jgi:hypothetical protein
MSLSITKIVALNRVTVNELALVALWPTTGPELSPPPASSWARLPACS